MNPEQAKALDKYIADAPEDYEEPDCDFFGEIIMDDDCVIVIDHQKYLGNGKYKWLTYDVLASNMNSFLNEVDEDEWADVEVMSGKKWREIK